MGTISVSLPSDGDTIDASDINNPINTIVGVINGGIDADNIEAGGVAPNALVSGTGTAWVWQSWTPSWVNLEKGNGTEVAKFIQIGKTVHFIYSLTFGSTTSITSTDPYVTAPVNFSSNYGTSTLFPIGVLNAIDTGTNQFLGYCLKRNAGSSTILPAATLASGTYTAIQGLTSTVPMTWTTGDILTFSGTYEAA